MRNKDRMERQIKRGLPGICELVRCAGGLLMHPTKGWRMSDGRPVATRTKAQRDRLREVVAWASREVDRPTRRRPRGDSLQGMVGRMTNWQRTQYSREIPRIKATGAAREVKKHEAARRALAATRRT